jgi:hypothetical protein
MCDIRYVYIVNLLLHTRNLSLFIDEHQRKPKVQSRMGKPETQTTMTNSTEHITQKTNTDPNHGRKSNTDPTTKPWENN